MLRLFSRQAQPPDTDDVYTGPGFAAACAKKKRDAAPDWRKAASIAKKWCLHTASARTRKARTLGDRQIMNAEQLIRIQPALVQRKTGRLAQGL